MKSGSSRPSRSSRLSWYVGRGWFSLSGSLFWRPKYVINRFCIACSGRFCQSYSGQCPMVPNPLGVADSHIFWVPWEPWVSQLLWVFWMQPGCSLPENRDCTSMLILFLKKKKKKKTEHSEGPGGAVEEGTQSICGGGLVCRLCKQAAISRSSQLARRKEQKEFQLT